MVGMAQRALVHRGEKWIRSAALYDAQVTAKASDLFPKRVGQLFHRVPRAWPQRSGNAPQDVGVNSIRTLSRRLSS
jgi:hypothetical protein